jgi:hypothetical protein
MCKGAPLINPGNYPVFVFRLTRYTPMNMMLMKKIFVAESVSLPDITAMSVAKTGCR